MIAIFLPVAFMQGIIGRYLFQFGVTITAGDRSDLAAFHPVYVETAHRDHFTPRGLAYFERMWDSLNSREERLRLYIAEHEGRVAACHALGHPRPCPSPARFASRPP